MKIELGKVYRMHNGSVARCIANDRWHPNHSCVLLWKEESRFNKELIMFSDLAGQYFWRDVVYQLTEVHPCDGLPIDAKILYSHSKDFEPALKGHYAGVDEEGNHKVWAFGGTSYSTSALFIPHKIKPFEGG